MIILYFIFYYFIYYFRFYFILFYFQFHYGIVYVLPLPESFWRTCSSVKLSFPCLLCLTSQLRIIMTLGFGTVYILVVPSWIVMMYFSHDSRVTWYFFLQLRRLAQKVSFGPCCDKHVRNVLEVFLLAHQY